MGNLLSRAIKRFTQCSSARNQLAAREQQEGATNEHQQAQQQARERDSEAIVQSIPVGQSIDSTDYASFESSASGTPRSRSKEQAFASAKTTIDEEADKEEKGQQWASDTKESQQRQTRASGGNKQAEQSEPQVEEAVIKIQALVRGHLTRKALKDAQQQAATPAPHALGQSQFDAESLTKNPPSGVFQNAPVSQASNPGGASRVPPLESIAEDAEGAPWQVSLEPPDEASESLRRTSATSRDNSRRKLSPINRSLAISADLARSGSVSPVPSEANVSIDLNCATPASASIDIMDHNIRPADPIASVLHHKTSGGPEEMAATRRDDDLSSWQSPRMVVVGPPEPARGAPVAPDASSQSSSQPHKTTAPTSAASSIQNSHSIDSTEAAAIRIQSAFRGYHTRKHSPYRRRSPGTVATAAAAAAASSWSASSPASEMQQQQQQQQPLSLDSALSNGNGTRRSPLRQQNATVALDDLEVADELELAGSTNRTIETPSGELDERVSRLQTADRRPSRQRQRSDLDDSQPTGAAKSGERSNTLDEASNDTCTSTLTIDADLDTSPLSAAQAAVLTRDDSSRTKSSRPPPLQPPLDQPPQDTNLAQKSARDELRLSSGDRNLSIEMDTESSNLGAALSLNEEAGGGEQWALEDGARMRRTSSIEEKSFGASLVADELASEAQRFVDQLVGEDDRADQARDRMEGELERVTSQLEAALEEATEDNNDQVAEDLANAILNEEDEHQHQHQHQHQRTSVELESDDIERRDPSGRASERRSKSARLSVQTGADQQPALVSSGSLDDAAEAPGAVGQNGAHEELAQTQRLAVESPDEAIGSGRSSPALVSSNGGSGSSDEDEADEAAALKTGRPGGAQSEDKQAQAAQQQVGAGNKNKKKNRARKKGRK